jgi:hypothetical protein
VRVVHSRWAEKQENKVLLTPPPVVLSLTFIRQRPPKVFNEEKRGFIAPDSGGNITLRAGGSQDYGVLTLQPRGGTSYLSPH